MNGYYFLVFISLSFRFIFVRRRRFFRRFFFSRRIVFFFRSDYFWFKVRRDFGRKLLDVEFVINVWLFIIFGVGVVFNKCFSYILFVFGFFILNRGKFFKNWEVVWIISCKGCENFGVYYGRRWREGRVKESSF